MPYLLARLKIEDYAKWKPIFDEHAKDRKEFGGSKGGTLFRNAHDENEFFVLLELEDLDKGRKFVESDNVKEAMSRAGVTGHDFYFLEEAEKIPG
ncbi:MAG: cyclase [Nitrospirae bacterium]|nr:cyclase [Nitrospirota bacterium]